MAVTAPPEFSRVNGVKLPHKETRSSTSFRPAGGNIAAIDFGTTSCSLVYHLKGQTEPYKLKLDSTDDRLPTAILLKPVAAADLESQRVEVVAFGHQARKMYYDLTPLARTTHYYFHQVKMHLQDEKVSIPSYAAINSVGS